MKRLLPVVALFAITAVGFDAHATDPRGVGLGVAAGVNLGDAENVDLDTSFAWGFFVDIPLLQTFYITPAAMVYELGEGDFRASLTDIDLNFKFIVPIGPMALGAGVTAGLTTGIGTYQGHYGALAYFGFNLVSNLDVFALAQYKRLALDDDRPDYNNIHIFAGGMFRF